MAYSKRAIVLVSLFVSAILRGIAPERLLARSIWITFGVLCLTQLVGMATYYIVLWPKFLSPLRHLPQPSGGSYFMGHLRRIMKEPSGHPQREWMQTVPNDGLLAYTTGWNKERVLLTSVKAHAEVLTQKSYDFIKPQQLVQGIGSILGIGILFAEGDEHKRQRKLLGPAFSYRHIKDLYPIFWAKTREMVLTVNEMISTTDNSAMDSSTSSNIEVNAIASRATLDIIGVAGFSRDFRSLADPSNTLYRTYNSVFAPSGTARIFVLLGLFFPFWLLRLIPAKRNNDIHAASQYVRQTCRELIAAKRTALEKKSEAPGVDILSVALESGGFSDEELVDQLMTFAAAGHETTASSMTWAIYLLCKYPEVQARLRKELAAGNLPSPFSTDASTMVSADLIDRIPYLTAVCNEVLRFHAPVPFTIREAARDGLTILGKPIPKGTTVVMSPVALNVAPHLWGSDADKFNPDRWLDRATGQANNTGGASSNYAFLTFLHGPRSCIGQGFAKAEFAVLLAGWVMAFETSLPDPSWEPEIGGQITTKPKGGLHVRVVKVAD